jgi:hypothetical protein
LFRIPNLAANLNLAEKEWLGSVNANDINYDVLTRDQHQAHGLAVHEKTGHVFVARIQYASPYAMSVLKFDPNSGTWSTKPGATPVAAVGDYLTSGRSHGNPWSEVYLGLKEEGEHATLWLSQVESLTERSSVAMLSP